MGRSLSTLIFLCLTCCPGMVGAQVTTNTFINFGASWRYLDDGSDQGTAWRAPTFDDTGWSNGVAELGFGDGDEATLVRSTNGSGQLIITTYFRDDFVLADAASYTNLALSLRRDDGGVVYLNGTEVFRSTNIPSGTVTFTTLTTSGGENTLDQATINGALSLLVDGTNTVAVEIHQQSTNSSDLSFDFRLEGMRAGAPASNAPPTASITSPTNGATYYSGANVSLSASASDSDGSVAQVQFFMDGFGAATDTAAPFSVVLTNLALGTHEFMAVSQDNLGARSTSSVVSVEAVLVPNGTNVLVARGSVWKHLDNNSDQGSAWRTNGFNDTGWAAGPAELGYGDGDEATVVSYGPNAGSKYITTYFRRRFYVADAAAHPQLIFQLLRDDGAVVYLNGVEVFRSNMAGGTVTRATTAPSSIGGSSESTFYTTLASNTNLVSGTNILAVEIHQDSVSSSDISFDLQLLSSPPLTATLSRGPYLQQGTTNGMIVRWRTDAAASSWMLYGTNAANLDQTVTNAGVTTEHIITVTGLAAETKYFYAIGSGTNTLAGDSDCFFITSPPIGPARSSRLWVLGDSGTANSNARAVRDSYLNFIATNSHPADLWLMLGDNAYNSGLDEEYQAAVFDMYPGVLRNTVLWPTIGNHETAQQTSITSFPYLDIFSLPQSGEAGGVPSGTERYYSFDHANIHFLCLDSMTSSQATNGAMANWLRDDLGSTTQKWLVAFWHHPPYTKGSHDSDAESRLINMRQNFLPILESFGVDLVLCGHSHAYERSYLLHGHYSNSTTLTAAMKVEDGNGRLSGDGAYSKLNSTGAVYVVAGSGGQASGGTLDHPAMFLSLNNLGSLVIDVTSDQLDLRMLGTSGNVRDYFTLRKPDPPSIASQPQGTNVVMGADATLAVTAAGSAELTYQWRSNGVPLAARTNATLTFPRLSTCAAASYDVIVSNVAGAVTSVVATVTVQPVPLLLSPLGALAVGGEDECSSVTLAGGASYRWELADTLGGAGLGWDLLNITGGLDIQSTPGNPLAIQLVSLNGSSPGTAANFDNDATNLFVIATTSDAVTNFSADKFQLDTAAFQNDLGGGAFSIEEGSLRLRFTPNHAPLAAPATFTRAPNVPLRIRISDLLAGFTSDPDGDPRALAAVSTTTNGTSLATNGTYILYTPADNVNDSFTYTVHDVRAAYRPGDTVRTATATVFITLAAPTGTNANIVSFTVIAGQPTLRFAGIPGYLYDIQRATNMAPAQTWTTLWTTSAPANGLFWFVDEAAPEGSAFYRTDPH